MIDQNKMIPYAAGAVVLGALAFIVGAAILFKGNVQF